MENSIHLILFQGVLNDDTLHIAKKGHSFGNGCRYMIVWWEYANSWSNTQRHIFAKTLESALKKYEKIRKMDPEEKECIIDTVGMMAADGTIERDTHPVHAMNIALKLFFRLTSGDYNVITVYGDINEMKLLREACNDVNRCYIGNVFSSRDIKFMTENWKEVSDLLLKIAEEPWTYREIYNEKYNN